MNNKIQNILTELNRAKNLSHSSLNLDLINHHIEVLNKYNFSTLEEMYMVNEDNSIVLILENIKKFLKKIP
jgi:hypothetical protein